MTWNFRALKKTKRLFSYTERSHKNSADDDNDGCVHNFFNPSCFYVHHPRIQLCCGLRTNLRLFVRRDLFALPFVQRRTGSRLHCYLFTTRNTNSVSCLMRMNHLIEFLDWIIQNAISTEKLFSKRNIFSTPERLWNVYLDPQWILSQSCLNHSLYNHLNSKSWIISWNKSQIKILLTSTEFTFFKTMIYNKTNLVCLFWINYSRSNDLLLIRQTSSINLRWLLRV